MRLERPTIVVAMSGGVDSSAAAALLVDQGYPVIGMMLRLWSEPGAEAFNRCCTPEAMGLARQVAAQLGIPFYAIDVREKFRQTVVQSFIDGYLTGVTPNPCLVCNREIRWGTLLEHARALGATHLATGHYARLEQAADGKLQLLKACDLAKDQSYVLSVLSQAQLAQAMFPLGVYTKTQAKVLLHQLQLPVSDRQESQDLCFLGGQDYREFLRRHTPAANAPGPILSSQGERLGEHAGLAFYTIGQRKGLGISSPDPLYVLDKDLQQNALVIGKAEQLGRSRLNAQAVNWIEGSPPTGPIRAEVKIRYQARPAEGTIYPIEHHQVTVVFDAPQRDITPGQAAVFYQGEVCLGGGIISQSLD